MLAHFFFRAQWTVRDIWYKEFGPNSRYKLREDNLL